MRIAKDILSMKRATFFGSTLLATLLVTGCAAGVKGTPGMKLYSAGDYEAAVPLLLAEVEAGEVSARYPLGLAYRDGRLVTRDPRKAEILFTGAAIGGDPRAVEAVRAMLREENLCSKDKALHDMWGSLVMQRNIITGVYELNNAPRGTLQKMAEIYAAPCPGRPVQKEAAQSLNRLSQGQRSIWIYVPG
jgi:TPR repeat protein